MNTFINPPKTIGLFRTEVSLTINFKFDREHFPDTLNIGYSLFYS